MFSLDVNFLNDPGRQDYIGNKGGKQGGPEGGDDGGARPSIMPAILGALAGIVLLAGAGGYWFYLNTKVKPDLQARSSQLDAQLSDLQTKLTAAEQVEQQAAAIEADSAALAGVFDKVKPWSAILTDIAQRTLPDIEIKSITEAAGVITISGVAISQTTPPYDKVNDFFLLLQRSPFLVAEETKLSSTALQETQPALPLGGERFKVSQLEVTFTITSNLKEQPNSQILAELSRLQATGIVSKVRAAEPAPGAAPPPPPPAPSPTPSPSP